MVELFHHRLVTLSEFFDKARAFFSDQLIFDQEVEQLRGQDFSKVLREVEQAISGVNPFVAVNLDQAVRLTAAELGMKMKEIVVPIRAAITGQKIGPGLFEAMEVLGKEKVIFRLKQFMSNSSGQ